jgi:hypothetical protein
VLWPWKNKLELLFTHSDGTKEWLLENTLPNFHPLEIISMIVFAAFGGGVVIGLDMLSKTK